MMVLQTWKSGKHASIHLFCCQSLTRCYYWPVQQCENLVCPSGATGWGVGLRGAISAERSVDPERSWDRMASPPRGGAFLAASVFFFFFIAHHPRTSLPWSQVQILLIHNTFECVKRLRLIVNFAFKVCSGIGLVGLVARKYNVMVPRRSFICCSCEVKTSPMTNTRVHPNILGTPDLPLPYGTTCYICI